MNIHIEHIQRQYTEAELLEFGKESARLTGEIASLEDEKKNATDHFKAQITERSSGIVEFSKRINQGYEIVPTPCDVFLNQPTKGMKQIVDKKTLNVIKTVPMTDADKQSSLFEDSGE